MPLQATSGAASYDGFGGGVPFEPTYIEQVFATHLYTGNSSTQTITNGIDLSTKGGLVWIKSRASGSYNHQLVDTTRGSNKYLNSNTTDAEATATNRLTAFNTDGFALGAASVVNEAPATGYAATYASWTFRKQPKFFDVVTYTGNGAVERSISHSLNAVPGFVIVKRTSASGDWWVAARNNSGNYFRSDTSSGTGRLNTTGPLGGPLNLAGLGYLTSTSFIPQGVTGGVLAESNASGENYVAYLFAHDAGGFGLTGTDNVISCGSFTTDGSGNATVSLGYEPQWVLIKQTDGVDSWYLNDNMRGMAVSGNQPNLSPNSSAAESAGGYNTYPNATGFTASVGIASKNYIYIAIRRGPMKTPTTGTSVFTPVASGNNVTTSGTLGFTTNIVTDLLIRKAKSGGSNGFTVDRLRGGTRLISTNLQDAESGTLWDFDSNVGVNLDTTSNQTGFCGWGFQRAPGFFDIVCYTGNGVNNRAVNHNLGVAPELFFLKSRSTGSWNVYYGQPGGALVLNSDGSAFGGYWNDTNPTATVFTISDSSTVNFSGQSYITYLFASCPGVSKVGTYTGTGTTQQINCGFTGGARFVLIKRVNGTGDWYVWDSARGIVSGNDPYLMLNNAAAEVTNTDFVDTFSAGFEISSTAPAAINANGGTFVFLAVA